MDSPSVRPTMGSVFPLEELPAYLAFESKRRPVLRPEPTPSLAKGSGAAAVVRAESLLGLKHVVEFTEEMQIDPEDQADG